MHSFWFLGTFTKHGYYKSKFKGLTFIMQLFFTSLYQPDTKLLGTHILVFYLFVIIYDLYLIGQWVYIAHIHNYKTNVWCKSMNTK